MRTIRFLIISFLTLIMLLACGKKHTEEKPQQLSVKPPAYGDIIVQGDIGDASNLIPLLASDTPSHDIAGLVYNGLVKYDKNMNIVGDLAESWEISANGLIITFHLRKGVKWHDGRPFTAADVLYTYQVTSTRKRRRLIRGFSESKKGGNP